MGVRGGAPLGGGIGQRQDVANKEQVVAALESTDLHVDFERVRWGITASGVVDTLSIEGSSAWALSDVEQVVDALQTKDVDAGGGCESCGYGATIYVSGIPHPWPCAGPGCTKLAVGVESYCGDECEKASAVNRALVRESGGGE